MIRTDDFFGYGSFTIEKGEISLRVIEYGAAAQSLRFRGKEMILGFDTLESYEKSASYIGAIVGRYANRIGGASFMLGGERVMLDANEGENTLHGGNVNASWSHRRWKGEIASENSVAFTLLSHDGDNGFPGAMEVKAVYSVTEDGIRIDFLGQSDRDTVFAPTTHLYFSLGQKNILSTRLRLGAAEYLEKDRAGIPTGRILRAEGDYDFSAMREIARDYDDCFVLSSSPACVAGTEDVRLTVLTDFPALQLYTGTFLDRGWEPHSGFAVEPEFFPDAPNKPEFPSTLLRAGERFTRYVEFRFS